MIGLKMWDIKRLPVMGKRAFKETGDMLVLQGS